MFVVGLFIVPSAEFYFFSSDSLNCAVNISLTLYTCGTTPIRLFWIPFEIPTQIKLPKFLFSKFSYPQRNPVMKIFKTKKKSLYHLGNFNSPLPLQPPPWAGPRVRYYCLRCSFWLLVEVRHFSPFLCLSRFLSVWKYPNALCNCIAICCIYKASVEHMSSKGVLPRS